MAEQIQAAPEQPRPCQVQGQEHQQPPKAATTRARRPGADRVQALQVQASRSKQHQSSQGPAPVQGQEHQATQGPVLVPRHAQGAGVRQA